MTGLQRASLRYRRFGGGYRREDVEVVLAEVRLMMLRLEDELETVRGRSKSLESELEAAQADIESLKAKERALSQTMSSALRRAAEIEDGASDRARHLIAQAEESATRIRFEATRRLDDAGAQFNDLMRLKDSLLGAMRAFVGDFDSVLARVERSGPQPAGYAAAPPPPPRQPSPRPDPLAPLPLPDPEAEGPSETRVELDAGPFVDFVELSAFERALADLPNIEDVYVRRLAKDRARIDVRLSEPTDLLGAMRETLPYSIVIRSSDPARPVVDVAAEESSEAR